VLRFLTGAVRITTTALASRVVFVKLVVGLGNPGRKYAGTRHNVGFDVVDLLAKRWSIDFSREKFHSWFADGVICDERVVLLKPTTYMNRSGRAVAKAVRFYQLEPPDLIVVLDDWALPPGRLRIRKKGSAGSHNGLQDVINHLGPAEFARLRVGIGESIGDPATFVLSRFAPHEEPTMERSVASAADAVESWIKEGPDVTMNRFNATGGDPS
jgi:peptidyl-tRNA hydrolase, PTH1 family